MSNLTVSFLYQNCSKCYTNIILKRNNIYPQETCRICVRDRQQGTSCSYKWQGSTILTTTIWIGINGGHILPNFNFVLPNAFDWSIFFPAKLLYYGCTLFCNDCVMCYPFFSKTGLIFAYLSLARNQPGSKHLFTISIMGRRITSLMTFLVFISNIFPHFTAYLLSVLFSDISNIFL